MINLKDYGLKVVKVSGNKHFIPDTKENQETIKSLYDNGLIEGYYYSDPFIIPNFIIVILKEDE